MARREQTDGVSSDTVAAFVPPLRYVGNGEYIMGVPARNLTVEEAALHADAIAANEAATGRKLYQAPPMTESEV